VCCGLSYRRAMPSLSAYELARLKRISENRKIIANLGLNSANKANRRRVDEEKKQKKEARAAAAQRKKIAQATAATSASTSSSTTTSTSAPSPLRRSSRKRGTPPSHAALTDTDFAESHNYRPSPRKKSRRNYSGKHQKYEDLTPTQLKVLDVAKPWMDALTVFLLRTPHGSAGTVITKVNLKRTLLKLSFLVSGAGIRYPIWGDEVFHPFPINLDTDTLTLLEDAKEMEDEYGRDAGNGWLTNHPITKLACYQVHLSKDDKELTEDEIKIKKKYTSLSEVSK